MHPIVIIDMAEKPEECSEGIEKVGGALITRDTQKIRDARAVVLPGVGIP